MVSEHPLTVWLNLTTVRCGMHMHTNLQGAALADNQAHISPMLCLTLTPHKMYSLATALLRYLLHDGQTQPRPCFASVSACGPWSFAGRPVQARYARLCWRQCVAATATSTVHPSTAMSMRCAHSLALLEPLLLLLLVNQSCDGHW